MAIVKGVWVFNENLSDSTQLIDETVSYYSNGLTCQRMYLGDYSDRHGIYSTLNYDDFDHGIVPVYDYTTEAWITDEYRTIDFGSTTQEVSSEFYTWLTANATQQASEEEPTGGVTITYNGNVIASLEAGQTATLNCADKVMAGDISVTAPIGGGVRKYSITYDDTDLYTTGDYEIIAAPTEIYEGQTIYALFAHTYSSISADAVGCDLTRIGGLYFNGEIYPEGILLTLSNPTADVTVTFTLEEGGSN